MCRLSFLFVFTLLNISLLAPASAQNCADTFNSPNFPRTSNLKPRKTIWSPYFSNLYENNQKNFLKIVKKRISLENLSEADKSNFIKSTALFYLHQCQDPFKICFQTLLKSFSATRDLILHLDQELQKMNDSCGIRLLNLRRTYLKSLWSSKKGDELVTNLMFESGLYDLVIKRLNEKSDKSGEDYLLNALSIAKLGQWQAFKKLKSQFLATQPSEKLKQEMSFREAVALYNSNQKQKALSVLEQLTQSQLPDSLWPWVTLELATQYLDSGQKEKSLQTLQKINQSEQSLDELFKLYQIIFSSQFADENKTNRNDNYLLGRLESSAFFDLFKFCQKYLSLSSDADLKKSQSLCNKVLTSSSAN